MNGSREQRSPLCALVLVSAAFGCGGATATTPTVEADEPERIAVALRLEAEEDQPLEDGMEVPASRAVLVLIHEAGQTERHDLGVLTGVCTPRPAEHGELARVECWWAGAGEHLVARRGGHHIVVMSTPVDEHTGEGTAELRARVPIADDAEIDTVSP